MLIGTCPASFYLIFSKEKIAKIVHHDMLDQINQNFRIILCENETD